MANLVRLKQIDQPELSGYIVGVTDPKYYPVGNPSGYLSSISSNGGALDITQFLPLHILLKKVASPKPNKTDIKYFPVSLWTNFDKYII